MPPTPSDLRQLLLRVGFVGLGVALLALLYPSAAPELSTSPTLVSEQLLPSTQRQLETLRLFQDTQATWQPEQLATYDALQLRPRDLLASSTLGPDALSGIRQQLLEGDWAAAQQSLSPLVAGGGGSAEAHFYLGVLLIPTAEALPHLQAAASDSHPSQEAAAQVLAAVEEGGLPAAAQALLHLREWPLAEYLLTRQIEANSLDSSAYAYRSYTHQQQGEEAAALRDLRMSLALEPYTALPYLMLGLYWQEHANYDLALDAFGAAISLEPQNAAAAAELASTHQLRGDLGQAESWYYEALSISGEAEEFVALLAAFYADENYKLDGVGLEMIEVAAETYPQNASLAASLGRAYLQLGDYPAAGTALEAAFALAPTMPRIRFLLAALLEIQGRPLEAISHYFFVSQTQNAYSSAARDALERLSR